MKIKQISVYKTIKPSFKQNKIKQQPYDDYDSYNSDITMKDAIISAGVVSSICYIGTQILVHEDKIKKFIFKIIKRS